MVITLPSDRVTVATVALLKSTSPAGVTSSTVNPLNAVGEGASDAASAALRPGGTPSSAKLSSPLGADGLAAAAAELAGPAVLELEEAAAPELVAPAAPELVAPAVPELVEAAVPELVEAATTRCTV